VFALINAVNVAACSCGVGESENPMKNQLPLALSKYDSASVLSRLKKITIERSVLSTAP